MMENISPMQEENVRLGLCYLKEFHWTARSIPFFHKTLLQDALLDPCLHWAQVSSLMRAWHALRLMLRLPMLLLALMALPMLLSNALVLLAIALLV
jgi:hypothetical protein